MKHQTIIRCSTILGALALGSISAEGVTVKSRGFSLAINAYLDFEYTNMSKMPMSRECTEAAPCSMMMNGKQSSFTDGNMIMEMPPVSTVDQNHMNVILSGRHKDTRTHINLESRHSFSTYDGNTGAPGRMGDGSGNEVGSFRVAEAYGDHKFMNALKLRAGNFNAPYGIYNEIRFATPLFATVVLPYIYMKCPVTTWGTL